MELVKKIFNAGVVGAGGAGFPAHIKAAKKVEYVLVNGAECEPLVHKDYEIMINFPGRIIQGLNLIIEESKADKGYFGIKSKNQKAIEAIESKVDNSKIELSLLGDFYPSGDEYELVYHATGRLIPPHGLPLDIGCLVQNVETLFNISNAVEDIPVTDKFVSVNGIVKKPSSFFIPVGTSFRHLIDLAEGTQMDDYAIFVSGLLMGKLTFDPDEVVTKTTAGIIILPKNHYLVDRMNRPIQDMNRIGKSACDQCSYCTEFCPRYLLGYDVQPHKVMRSLGFTTSGESFWNQYADLCCSCGLCSLYACPEDLYPREACVQGKSELKNRGFVYQQPNPVKVHPIKEGRRVPLNQLMKRIDVLKYDKQTPFVRNVEQPGLVKVFLKQHIGVYAKPIVQSGSVVHKGDMIASVGDNEIGAKIHAPIYGKVKKINSEFIIIES